MKTSLLRSRAFLVTPLVLLTVVLLESVATYKLRQLVRNVEARTAIIFILNGAAFEAAADWVSPWMKRVFTSARTSSRRRAGALGPWLFYAVAYGALYFAYLILEIRGASGLLPRFLR
jgi:hypothetical protein